MKAIQTLLLLFIVVILAGLAYVAYGASLTFKSYKATIALQTKIQEENHKMSLYAEYRANMDSCRQEALKQDKDIAYVQANCIEVINSSMLGEMMRGWKMEKLFVTE